MSSVLASPAEVVKMMRRGAPHLIHDDRELEVYTTTLFELTRKESPTADEVEVMELLGMLVEKYEEERYPIASVGAVDMVRFLMDQHGLQQRDLTGEFGTESAVSMFLNGTRRLSLDQLRRLTERFGLSADLFLH